MNIHGYVRQASPRQQGEALSCVDILALTMLTYIDFSPFQTRFPLSIHELSQEVFYKTDPPYYDYCFLRDMRRYFYALSSSARFQDAEVLDFVDNRGKDFQFRALAVRHREDILVLIEGTDISYSGWREDFMLSYRDAIPSYDLAQAFLVKIIDTYHVPVILAGHSKGGAVCAHLLSVLEDDSFLRHVYSFDGPGFRGEDIFASHPARREKLTKIVPQSSLVGVLFGLETDINIIQSHDLLVLQHNPFRWVIVNGDFLYRSKRSYSSFYMDKAMNGWIDSVSVKQRERFSALLFDSLSTFKAKDFKQFGKALLLHIVPAYQAYRGFNKEDQSLFRYVVGKLFQSFAKATLPNPPKKKRYKRVTPTRIKKNDS